MMASTPERELLVEVERALLEARDGRGRVVVAADAEQMSAALESLRVADVCLVEVAPAPRLRDVAFGAVVVGLHRHVPHLGQEVVATSAPERTSTWRARSVEMALATLAQAAPVLVVVPRGDLLDAATREWLSDSAALQELGVVWLVTWTEVHESAGSAIEASGELSPFALRVAQVLAVSHIGVRREELSELTGLAPAAVRAELDALDARGWIAGPSGEVVLSGPARRADLVGKLPVAVVLGLKREVIAVLARRPVPAAALAEAAVEVLQHGDHELISLLAAATTQLAGVDPEAAAIYGLAAVEQLDATDELLTTLAWQLLPLLWRTARREAAHSLVARVFTERGQAEAEAQVLLWLGRLEPEPAEALQLTTAALALGEVSALTRARLRSVQLRCLSTLGRVDDVDALLPDALELAESTGDPDSISRLRTCDGIRHFYRGHYNSAADLTRIAEHEWMRSGAPHENRVPEMVWAPHLLAVLGEPQAAHDRLTRLMAGLSSGPSALGAPLLHAERSQVLLVLGRLAEARDEAVVADAQWQRVWGRGVSVNDRLAAILLAVRLKVALHRGDAVELQEVKEILGAARAREGSEAARRLDWYRFLVDEMEGTTGSARLVDPATLVPVPWLDPSDEVMTVRALLMQGHRWPAEQIVRQAGERARSDGGHLLATTLDAHLHGLLAWRQDLIERALDGWERLGRPLLVSHARSDLGSKLMENGDAEGVAMMVRAHDELVAFGAHRDARRIRWYLRLRGHVLDDTPVPDLTPTEARVAQLAVLTGHTVGRLAEDLGLSPHTVSTHLRHIYLKLGITSRAELAAWADSA